MRGDVKCKASEAWWTQGRIDKVIAIQLDKASRFVDYRLRLLPSNIILGNGENCVCLVACREGHSISLLVVVELMRYIHC